MTKQWTGFLAEIMTFHFSIHLALYVFEAAKSVRTPGKISFYEQFAQLQLWSSEQQSHSFIPCVTLTSQPKRQVGGVVWNWYRLYHHLLIATVRVDIKEWRLGAASLQIHGCRRKACRAVTSSQMDVREQMSLLTLKCKLESAAADAAPSQSLPLDADFIWV